MSLWLKSITKLHIKTIKIWESPFVYHIWSHQHGFKYWDVMLIGNKQEPGGRLNKKDGLTSYGDSHVKDKTS